jgi:hypothetical protein
MPNMLGGGPPPKPAHQRARRNATFAMTSLPAEGRQGPPPPWPIGPDSGLAVDERLARDDIARLQRQIRDTEDGRVARKYKGALDGARERLAKIRFQVVAQELREAEVWAEVWATPQAVQWERMLYTREVAKYVRYTVLGELGDLDAAKEARQFSDRLGLNPMALLRLRWQIVEDEVAAKRAEHTATPAAAGDPFAALRAV